MEKSDHRSIRQVSVCSGGQDTACRRRNVGHGLRHRDLTVKAQLHGDKRGHLCLAAMEQWKIPPVETPSLGREYMMASLPTLEAGLFCFSYTNI